MRRHRAIVRWFAPGALAVLVMLPRLASPQFGLLDDGLTLQTGQETIGRWASVLTLIPETGRFFPAYWLVYSAVVGVVGIRPLGFFVFNVLVLSAVLIVLARLVQAGGGTRLSIAAAVVLFATCGPVIEAFYTLSKAEPLQMLWIGVSLLAAAASARASRAGTRGGFVALAAAALVFGYATKETSVVLVVVSFAWVAIEWATRGVGVGARFAQTYAAVNVVAAAAFFALRWRYASLALADGTYTRAYMFHADTLGPALFRIAAWLLRDFLYLLPLLVAAAVAFRYAAPEARRGLLYAVVWMAGWLGVFTPWPATFEYYLLPFAFGASLFAGLVVGVLWSARGQHAPVTARRVAWSALVASAVLWPPALVNAAADGRVQLAVDRANADLVDFLGTLPHGSRVLLNTVHVNEYYYELPMHLTEIKRRPDLVVQHVGLLAAGGPAPSGVVVVTPRMANQPRPTVRIAPYDAGDRRAAEILSGGALLYSTERYARVVELRLHRPLCDVAKPPFLDRTFCADPRLVDARRFMYGWQVHRLSRPADAPGARPT